MTTAAILLAGGSGSRLQQEVNKVYLPVADRPILGFALDTLEQSPHVDRVVLVIRPEDQAHAEDLLSSSRSSKVSDVVFGGPSRHQSEIAGLTALDSAIGSGATDIVAIHDGARPFMTLALLHDVIEGARRTGGAVPSLPVDTPIFSLGPTGLEPVAAPDLHRMQTPQAFSAKALAEAYNHAAEDGFEGWDTADTVERYSDTRISVVEGDSRNVKITYVEDFFVAESLATRWHNGKWIP